MRTYKTTTYKQVTEETTPFLFVRIAENKHLEKLKKDEYFATMVTDYANYDSPHIKGIDIYDHNGLVGIEKTSGENGFYISKDYNKRNSYHRGKTVIVSVSKENLNKCCIL